MTARGENADPRPPADPGPAALRNGIDAIDVVPAEADAAEVTVHLFRPLPAQPCNITVRITRRGSDRPLPVTGVTVVHLPDEGDFPALRFWTDDPGDGRPYTLELEGIPDLDPFYATAEFHFREGCDPPADCAAAAC